MRLAHRLISSIHPVDARPLVFDFGQPATDLDRKAPPPAPPGHYYTNPSLRRLYQSSRRRKDRRVKKNLDAFALASALFLLAPVRPLCFINTMQLFMILGAVNAFISVAAGAFGAHGLRARLASDLLATFETAARYQMYHALGLMAVGWVIQGRPSSSSAHAAGWSMLIGIVLFCGSLYVLTLTGLRWLGAITPLGGVAFLLGWALLAWSIARG